jgi:hypothetical protein
MQYTSDDIPTLDQSAIVTSAIFLALRKLRFPREIIGDYPEKLGILGSAPSVESDIKEDNVDFIDEFEFFDKIEGPDIIVDPGTFRFTYNIHHSFPALYPFVDLRVATSAGSTNLVSNLIFKVDMMGWSLSQKNSVQGERIKDIDCIKVRIFDIVDERYEFFVPLSDPQCSEKIVDIVDGAYDRYVANNRLAVKLFNKLINEIKKSKDGDISF